MPHSRREHQQSGTTGSCNPGESSGEGSGRKKGTCHWAIADVWAAIAERKRNRGQESPQTQITQEEGPKAKQRRQEDGTGMTTEGRAEARGRQKGSNRRRRAVQPKKAAKAMAKGKIFQYVCPHCNQWVSSTIRTGQVDHRRTCSNSFGAREGRPFAKAYDYMCPACNGHVASNVATGQIDHRTCLWEPILCEG